MSPQHMCPEEAGRAWKLLGARVLVAMHWGTFKLTDEPIGEPPERARAWFREHGHSEERLWILDIGETRALYLAVAIATVDFAISRTTGSRSGRHLASSMS